MMPEAYLTIDDSFSARSIELIDYLVARDIPAIFFVRGDLCEQYPEAALHAIKEGFVLANHSYAHRPSGGQSFEEWRADFEKAEAVIDNLYAQEGVARPAKYFRFPYLDRGDGDRMERRFAKLIADIEAGKTPSLPQGDKIPQIQAYLAERGFTQPFKDVDHPLYQVEDVAQAHDCLITYSTCDWMMHDRHKDADWPYKTLDDLKRAMDNDPYLFKAIGRQIVLVHDHAEIFEVVIALIEYMQKRGIKFIGV